MSSVVTLTTFTEVFTTMRAHAERTFPEECVGALLFDGEVLVRVLPLENAAAHRTSHFALSAGDYLAAESAARQQGLTLSGFYHSHPDGSPLPSSEDAVNAQPGWWTVILPVTKGVAAAPRAFRFDPQGPSAPLGTGFTEGAPW